MRGTETLRIRVLGGLALEADGRPRDPPAGRPARSVLGWLALHPGQHQRAAVAAALWPDVLDASARASLRTALSAVRRALGDAADAALLGGRDQVGLAGPPHVEVDALAFERLLEAGRTADALALARGDLLPELGTSLEARDPIATTARPRWRRWPTRRPRRATQTARSGGRGGVRSSIPSTRRPTAT